MKVLTTVRVVNMKGEYIKAYVSCAGRNIGFTNYKSGINFELSSGSRYTGYAKQYNHQTSFSIRAGEDLVVRLNT